MTQFRRLLPAWYRALGARPTGPRLARIQGSAQVRQGRFQNLPSRRSPLAGLPSTLPGPRKPQGPLPVRQLGFEEPASALRATWMGHASVLVELEGVRLLLDPVWADRCSPLQSLGPGRFHPTPIALEDLPEVDAVVISHDHYDHLDMAAIQVLQGTRALFFVPLGVGAHLEAWGVEPHRIRELDWHDATTLGPITLRALPAQHFSGRSLGDRNRTLWASWSLEGAEHRVFFGGDSGYFDGLKTIGQAHGPFDLTLLGIGAYSPMWAEVHMNPEEAAQAHLDLRGEVLLPIHWGTFNLAFHAWHEPAERLLAAAEAKGIECRFPIPGEPVEPSLAFVHRAWWRNLGLGKVLPTSPILVGEKG